MRSNQVSELDDLMYENREATKSTGAQMLKISASSYSVGNDDEENNINEETKAHTEENKERRTTKQEVKVFSNTKLDHLKSCSI